MTRREPLAASVVTAVMRRQITHALLLAALVSAAPVASAGGVRLRTLDGADTTLADQVTAGRWTLMMVWTTYCSVCRGQFPIISAFHTRHREHDATVVGIAVDGYAAIDAVRAYVAQNPFTFPTVVGEADIIGGAFAEATGEAFTGTPSYLLFDPARKLVAARAGELTLDALESYIAKDTP